MKRKALMTKLNDKVTIGSLRRLVEGDLSHIGHAILKGETIRNKITLNDDVSDLMFNASTDSYEIVKPINKIVIKQCPEIEVVQMIVPNGDDIFNALFGDIFQMNDYKLTLKPNSKIQSNFIQATFNEGAEIEVDYINGDETTTYKLTVVTSEKIRTSNNRNYVITCELTKPKVEEIHAPTAMCGEKVEHTSNNKTVVIEGIKDSIDCQSIINDLIDKGYSLRVRQNDDAWNISGVL